MSAGLGSAADLAPSGTLRVGLVEAPNCGAFFVSRTQASRRLQGVTFDLGAAFAAQAGLEVEYTVFPNSGECTEATASGAVDVAFMPVDDLRRAKVAFGPAYYMLESTYLVSAASGVTNLAEVDQAHIRVVGIAGTTTIRASAQTLGNTVPVAVRSVEEATAMVRDGHADALALSRDSLKPVMAAVPGSRILDGGFQRTGISIAVPRGRPAALARATAFIEGAKASGALRAIFDGAGLADELVAPPDG